MTINEVKFIFRILTINRIWNLIKLHVGFWISRILRKPVLLGDPFAVSIEPTTVCNLKCPECPTGLGTLKRSKGTMVLDTFNRVISGLSPNTFYVNMYLQGEPFIHPNLIEWIEMLNTKRLFTVVSTNAQLIDEKIAERIVLSGLSKIIIALDGLTQQSYSVYRRGGFVDKVYNSIDYLQKAKKKHNISTPIIVAQFLAFKHNQSEINSLKQLKLRGVNSVEVKIPQFDLESHKIVQPSSEKKLTRYFPNNGNLVIKSKRYSHCWRIWSSMVISWDGNSYPCCFDKDGDFEIGSVNNLGLEYIWKSDSFMSVRKNILKRRQSIKMCNNCTEGVKWWI